MPRSTDKPKELLKPKELTKPKELVMPKESFEKPEENSNRMIRSTDVIDVGPTVLSPPVPTELPQKEKQSMPETKDANPKMRSEESIPDEQKVETPNEEPSSQVTTADEAKPKKRKKKKSKRKATRAESPSEQDAQRTQMEESTWMGGLENIDLCESDPIQTNPRSLTKLFKNLLRVDVADAEGSRTDHERNPMPEETTTISCGRERPWSQRGRCSGTT